MARRYRYRDRVVYRDVPGPTRTRYVTKFRDVPVGQDIRRYGGPPAGQAVAKPRAAKQSVRPRRVSSGSSLLYRPRKSSGFGRRYLRFLFGKASGAGGRGFARKSLCGGR